MATYQNITPHVLVIDQNQVEPLSKIEIPEDHQLLSKLLSGGYIVPVVPPSVLIVETHESYVAAEPVKEEAAPVPPKKKPGRPKKNK